MEYTYRCGSPLGPITLAGDGSALTGLWFDGQEHFAASLDNEHEERFLPVFRETEQWLACYFSGRAPGFTPALSPKGTAFRRAVWDILLSVPYGKTVTYGEIADTLSGRTGVPVSPRAVGGAVGHNPISLIIPCHRVIGADGSMTGYAGGLGRKARLLELEGVLPGDSRARRP